MEQGQEKPKINYETLWKFIIRPPRQTYDKLELSGPQFRFNDKYY